MAQSIDNGRFWLPPEFLTDDDILMEKGINKVHKSKSESGFQFGTDGSKCLFPYELGAGLGYFGFSPDLGSPVESMVGSTETASEEEDYLTGLTRQMAHSTLNDDFAGNNRTFPSDNTKGWGLSGSPKPMLCSAGIGCGCRQRSTQSYKSRVSSQVAAWDLYCAAAEEVARIRMNEESYVYNHSRGLLGAPRKPSVVPLAAKNTNLGGGYTNPSLSYQKLQATQFQQLKQQQMMKQRQHQFVQNRGSVHNGRPRCLSPSAWPTLQHQRTESGMRAVLLGNATGKRECAGTGVFLPRRVTTTTTPAVTRTKPALSTAMLPARVVQALKLDLDDPADAGFILENDASLRVRDGNVYGKQKPRSVRPSDPSVTHELRLPQDWSY